MRACRWGSWARVVLAVGMAGLAGCHGGAGGGDASANGGAGGASGAGGAAGGGGAGGGGTGGADAGAGGSGGTARDCFPPCIANLRRNCERPPVDGGSCIEAPGVECYSNGVRDQLSFVDGGQIDLFTLPDGKTTCYEVHSEATGVSHYLTSSGEEVAQVQFANGSYMVTCDGVTTTVNATDPSCATLTIRDCVAGTCP